MMYKISSKSLCHWINTKYISEIKQTYSTCSDDIYTDVIMNNGHCYRISQQEATILINIAGIAKEES